MRNQDRGADLGADDAPLVRVMLFSPAATPDSWASTIDTTSSPSLVRAKPIPAADERHRGVHRKARARVGCQEAETDGEQGCAGAHDRHRPGAAGQA